MDPQQELQVYVKHLEELVKARTDQLRQAVANYEALLHLLGDAAPALQKVDDPTVKKLMEKVPVSLEAAAPPFGGKPGEPVPAVDPDDLKAVWQLHRDVEARYPGERFAIGMSVMASACKPNADLAAIAYRAGQLAVATQLIPQQLTKFHDDGSLDDAACRAAINDCLPAKLSNPIEDGQPDDALFRAAASVPMEWMGAGVITDRLPFDIGELADLVSRYANNG